VAPGTTSTVTVSPFVGTTEATCDPHFFIHSFQVDSVNSDGLLGQTEVALGKKDGTPFARFISFAGAPGAPSTPGVPNVFVSFSTELEATCHMRIGKVVFTLRDDGGNILNQQTTDAEKSPKDLDTRNVLINVSYLPAGTHTMEVQVFPGDPAFNPLTASWSYPIEVVDLSARWFSGNAHKDAGKPFIHATVMPDQHALKYTLQAVVPSTDIKFNGADITLGPLALANHAMLGVKLEEYYDSERHYGGHAVGNADIALLKLSAFNKTLDSLVDINQDYPFNGPKGVGGPGFFGAGYSLPETSLGSATEEIPIFGGGKQKCIKFCLFGCKKCVGFKIGLFAKVQGGADLGMSVTPSLGVRALVAPCVKASLPLIFQLDVVVCSAGAKAEAAASARLPLRFDFDNGVGFGQVLK
jgi:hypothetical protein